MGIALLDCTLRDGGYINDWAFGQHAIRSVISDLSLANIDIIEVGFLRNELYNRDRSIFSSSTQLASVLPATKQSRYAAMVEISNPFPVDCLPDKADSPLDIIRVIVWKEMLKESLAYSKDIRKKGYDVCIQPVRVNQYNTREFMDMVQLFEEVSPCALYIVDSWGTQHKEQIGEYAYLADAALTDRNIAIGYHGHNNFQQTLSCAQTMLELGISREIWLDASVYGIGRGAGNLHTEIIAGYLNLTKGKSYNLFPLLDIYNDVLRPLIPPPVWGYSVPALLTAHYDSNPEYANFYGQKLQMDTRDMGNVLASMSKAERLRFTAQSAIEYKERRKQYD
jgi:4-hydroxy 2-oxovalerate aldolase